LGFLKEKLILLRHLWGLVNLFAEEKKEEEKSKGLAQLLQRVATFFEKQNISGSARGKYEFLVRKGDDHKNEFFAVVFPHLRKLVACKYFFLWFSIFIHNICCCVL
jgi:hypothetical protein